MRRALALRILYGSFLPSAAYLFAGLSAIELFGAAEYRTYFIVWGVIASFIMAVREAFSNRAVTAGIAVYAAAVVLWFTFFADGQYRIHAVLAVAGLCGGALFQKLFQYKKAAAAVGVAAIIFLICLEFADIHFSKGVIALAIMLFLNAVSETVALVYHGSVSSLLVLYAAVAAATVFTPSPDEPYDWAFVLRAAEAVEQMAENIAQELQYRWGKGASGGVFRYVYTGYSDAPSPLTARLSDQDATQLVLDGKRTKRNLYLKGSVNGCFTGTGWDSSGAASMDWQTDTLITLYALFDYSQDMNELHRFMEVHAQELTLSYIRTQSYFYPLKLLNTTVQDMQSDGDNPVSEQVRAKGDSYSYQFVDLDYASPELARILACSGEIRYEEETYDLMFEKMRDAYAHVDLEKPPFDVFVERAAQGQRAVEEQYGIVENAVSEQVKSLAAELTLGCKNDYEKCRALERYLYQYRYNKDVNVPEGANVLDWFLFESREGCCVHYATALAEMLRCVGVPSRVAEGFLVDYKDSSAQNHYEISGMSAHAWVEAYIRGFGWIRLEPTVVNAPSAYAVWYKEPSEFSDGEWEAPAEAAGDDNAQIHPEEDSGQEGSIWITAAVLLCGFAAFIAAILLGLWIHRRRALQKSSDPDVILRHILSLLGKKYSPKEDSETVREYFGRLSADGQIPDEAKESFPRIAEWMEAYWYAGVCFGAKEICAMKEVRELF